MDSDTNPNPNPNNIIKPNPNQDLEFNCPHCNDFIIVNINEINCGIFRHAVFKENMNPINPHETQINCEDFVQKKLVFGCAKPFQITKQEDKYVITICGYI